MKYNLEILEEAEAAWEYLAELSGKEAVIEIKKINPKRSLNQNSYLHLLITAFGDFCGYTTEEAKMVYKYINKDIYKYEKNGMSFWRSSADLDKQEMARSIDRLFKVANEYGIQLPLAVDQDWLRRIENDHERLKNAGLV